MCNFLEYKGACPNWRQHSSSLTTLIDTKIVYRRYASLFFIAGIDSTDNELITLEIVHRFVEQMDKYYGNVCELDIIFNFQKAYFILDELLLAGEMQESSKKNVLKCIGQQDSLEDMEVSEYVCALQVHCLPIPYSRHQLPKLMYYYHNIRPRMMVSRRLCNDVSSRAVAAHTSCAWHLISFYLSHYDRFC
jgi:hypothetical protein